MSLFLLVGGLVLFGFAVYVFVYSIIHVDDTNILSLGAEAKETKSDSPLFNWLRPLVRNLTLQYAVRIKNERYRKNVEKKILTAGVSHEMTVDEFIGLQVLCGIFFPVTFAIINFGLQMGYPYEFSAFIVVFGFMYPNLYCNQKKEKRYTEIIKELPFVTEVLALSTEAGLDFIGSIQRITEKNKSTLCKELENVLRDIKLGSSREKALRRLSSSLDIPEVTSFCSVIIDADQTGASIATVLKEQSEQMRVERFVRAEKAGAKASQMILLPMMIFILPAVFLIIFAPIIVQFVGG